MAFSDPQSITIDGNTVSLPRVSTGENKSTYRDSTSILELVASHTYGKRTRRALRLNNNLVVADPYLTSVNVPISSSITLVVDTPAIGTTAEEMKDAIIGFTSMLTASSGALLTEFLGGES